MKKLFVVQCLTLALLFSLNSFAQKSNEGYGNQGSGASGGQPNPNGNSAKPGTTQGEVARDGSYDKISKLEKQILNYDDLREADIFWQKRVWRVIDTKQKMNLEMMYPKEPLITVLLDIAKKNPDKARIYMDDEFKTPISIADVQSRLGSADTITVTDPVTYQEVKKVVQNDFDWTAVSKFRMKEDWLFDKETSMMICRILAIAPIRDVIDDNGNNRGTEAMFYAYYPDFRPFLVKYEVFNSKNDSQMMTWEDIFEMRFFSSYIMKESNMYDRRIQEYATGRDALLESEKVKGEIFQKEEGLWSY